MNPGIDRKRPRKVTGKAAIAQMTCLIFGGCGYIGSRLVDSLIECGQFKNVTIADINPPARTLPSGAEFLFCDVRAPIGEQIRTRQADWIFNLSAVHREPGHTDSEYFDTNIAGAQNVCAFAEMIGCHNLFFFSSIAVYGRMIRPVNEKSLTAPHTPYGMSKLAAELIHQGWQRLHPQNRLAIVRPGVIYGPGDPGNVLRMIKAIKRGIFIVPSTGSVKKSYGYIYGLLDSVLFIVNDPRPFVLYNYVEEETESLLEIARQISRFLGLRRPIVRTPVAPLIVAAKAAQILSLGTTSLHAARVRKAAQSTHVVPQVLIDSGFKFRFGFQRSLSHWSDLAPEDFR